MAECGNKLLVVEDDVRLAERLAAGLSEAGYAVECALSGEDAQRHVREAPSGSRHSGPGPSGR